MEELKFKEQEELLINIVKSWEKIDQGNHSVKKIQDWLIKDMKPSIDAIRSYLNS